MLDQRLRLILDQQIDRENLGIHQVRKGKIDNPIASAERDRGLGTLARQRIKALTFTTRHHQGKYFRVKHGHHLPGLFAAVCQDNRIHYREAILYINLITALAPLLPNIVFHRIGSGS